MAQRYNSSPIGNVLALYTTLHEEEVEGFLEKNTFLVPLLSETYENIEKYFSYSRITLDLEIDDEDATESLAAHVITRLSVVEAYKQLKQFDRQWWLKVVQQAKSKFYVNLEFE